MDGTGGASTDGAHNEEDGTVVMPVVPATGSAAATGDGGHADGDAWDAFGALNFTPPDRAAPGEEETSPLPAPAESAAAAGESGGSGGIPSDAVASDAGEMGDVGGPPPASSGSNNGTAIVEPRGDVGGAGSELQTSSETPHAMSPTRLSPRSPCPLADGSGGSGGGSGGSGGSSGHVGQGFTGGSSATPPPDHVAFEGAGLGPGGTFGQREPALFGDVGGDGGLDSLTRVDSEDPVSVQPLHVPLEAGPAATLAAGSGGSGGGWASPAFQPGRGDLGGFADFDSPAVAASSGATDGAQHLAAEHGEEGSGGSGGGGNVVTPHGGHGGSGEPMTLDGGNEMWASATFASTAAAPTAVPLVSSSTGNTEDHGAAIASAVASSGEPRPGDGAAASPTASVDDPGATPGSGPVAFNPTGGSGSDDPGGTPACAEGNAAMEPQDSAGTTAVDASATMAATMVAEVVCDDDPGSTPSLEHGDSGGLFGGSQAADSGSGAGPGTTANNSDASTAAALGAVAVADDSGANSDMLQGLNSDLSGTGAAGSPAGNCSSSNSALFHVEGLTEAIGERGAEPSTPERADPVGSTGGMMAAAAGDTAHFDFAAFPAAIPSVDAVGMSLVPPDASSDVLVEVAASEIAVHEHTAPDDGEVDKSVPDMGVVETPALVQPEAELAELAAELSGSEDAGNDLPDLGVVAETGVASAFDAFAVADADQAVDGCTQADSTAGLPLCTGDESSAGDGGLATFPESPTEPFTGSATPGAGFAFDEDDADNAGFASFGALAPAATGEVAEPAAEAVLEREQAEEIDMRAAISSHGFAFDEDDEDDGFANFAAAAPSVAEEAVIAVQKQDGHETSDDDFTNFEGPAATLTEHTVAQADKDTEEPLENTNPSEAVVPREAEIGQDDDDSDDFADFAAASPEPAVEAASRDEEEDSDDGFADFATADASAVPGEAVATEATPADDDEDWDFAASAPAAPTLEDEAKSQEAVQEQMRDILSEWAKRVESCSEFVAVKELLEAGEQEDTIALADGANDWDEFLSLQAGVPDEVRQLLSTPAVAESEARCTVPLASLGIVMEAEGSGPPGTVVRETFLAALGKHLQLPATLGSDPTLTGAAAVAEAGGIPGIDRLHSDDGEGLTASPQVGPQGTVPMSQSRSQDAAASRPVAAPADSASNTMMGDADWALFETGGAGSSRGSAVAMVPPAPGRSANSFQIAPPPGSRSSTVGTGSQGEDVLTQALSDFGLSDSGMSDARFASATPASQAPIPALAAPLTSGLPGVHHSSGSGGLSEKVRKFLAGLPDLSHMHSNKLVAAT